METLKLPPPLHGIKKVLQVVVGVFIVISLACEYTEGTNEAVNENHRSAYRSVCVQVKRKEEVHVESYTVIPLMRSHGGV